MTNQHRDYLHTIDVAVLRLNFEVSQVEVLVHKRLNDPFAGSLALPGLVVSGSTVDTSLPGAVKRLMDSDKVGMATRFIEQVGTVGDAYRDPRAWSSSTYYLAFPEEHVELSDDQMWLSMNGILSGAYKLPFDHNTLCEDIFKRLESKARYSSIPLYMIGRDFTVGEAVAAFSIVLSRPVQKSSMRKRIVKMLEDGYLVETGEKRSGSSGPKSEVYRLVNGAEPYIFDSSLER
ncbi:ADP-ribose pyrophosphatase YjhB (NUDIX family) [Pseudomonas nitritireducens]|uniref:ADP-ribose pyrophosphatase YjhB (NUDIX family) n=1 Tax=Pseudomonas nitroreducens TaxID=46680 RepID=A0A7W7P4F7_PSENT|nr:NUDIX hydrolase [Pseudomonas nitritireducens]MBB4866839.1 ADP-ribose pyrophosphatase YjhB (NUDIX family) [Pseudomonas nitritireducens]